MSVRAAAVLSLLLTIAGVALVIVAAEAQARHQRAMVEGSLAAIGKVRELPAGEAKAHIEQLTSDVDARKQSLKTMRWVFATGLGLLAGGALVGMWGLRSASTEAREQALRRVSSDRTSRRGLEELLKRRLEELYSTRFRAWENERFAAYGELAAGLSHGLKTPLATVRAAAQLAQKKLDDEHSAQAQLDDIILEVDTLVDQIQRFLRSAGQGDPVPARMDARDLLHALDEAYAPQAKERGVEWRIEPNDSEQIQVDPALLEMALRNIVENALAAAPAGTEVTVTSGPADAPDRAGLDMQPPEPGPWVEIAIEDSGAGIPRDVLNAKEVDSQKVGGSGLGLAIARRVVARHGGALAFATPSHGGTVVRVLLPAAQASEE